MTPREELAVRLFHTGAAKTKAEAMRAVGISTWPEGADVMGRKIADALDQRFMDTGMLLRVLGREGLETIADTMRDPGAGPALRLKAAIDLADRGPETSKIQRHTVMSAQFSGDDLRALADAINTSALHIYGSGPPALPAELELVTIDQSAGTEEVSMVPRAQPPTWAEDDSVGPLAEGPS